MLKRIEISGFRNYEQASLDLPYPGITCLVGNNGEGKTNILEAIQILALGKSFRTGDKSALIGWGQDFARIKGWLADETELEYFISVGSFPSTFKKNEAKVGLRDFMGQFRVILFHPEDLNLLYLTPDLRRRYLDICGIQMDEWYFEKLRKFDQIRRQRNALLTRLVDNRQDLGSLAVWEEQLAAVAADVSAWRSWFCQFLNQNLISYYEQISGKIENIRVVYKHSLGQTDSQLEKKVFEEQYLSKLANNLERDLSAGFTTTGPHRDDLLFYLNEKPIEEHASRGEFRTLLLAMKLIELEFYQQKGEECIVLLDDVFSELDEERQKKLLARLISTQTIITTTPDHLYAHKSWLADVNVKVVSVQRGNLLTHSNEFDV